MYALIAALLAVVFIPDIENRFMFQEALGLSLLGLFIAWQLKLRFKSWWLGAAFLYPFGYGVYQWVFADAVFEPLGHVMAARFGSQVAGSLIILVLFATVLIASNTRQLSMTLASMFWVGSVAAPLVIWSMFKYTTSEQFSPIMSNPAVDASFLACLLGLLWPMFRKPMILTFGILMILAIVLTRSSTGLAAIGVSLASFWYSKKKGSAIPRILAVFILIVYFGLHFLGGELLNPNGREMIWKTAMNFYFSGPRHLQFLGYGPGTFFLYGPPIQLSSQGATTGVHQAFFWLHNDWLQIFFELGVPGLVLTLGVFVLALRRSWRVPPLFSMVCTYGFVMITQMPLHQFLFQALGCTLLGLVID